MLRMFDINKQSAFELKNYKSHSGCDSCSVTATSIQFGKYIFKYICMHSK